MRKLPGGMWCYSILWRCGQSCREMQICIDWVSSVQRLFGQSKFKRLWYTPESMCLYSDRMQSVWWLVFKKGWIKSFGNLPKDEKVHSLYKFLLRWWLRTFLYEIHVGTNEWNERNDNCSRNKPLGLVKKKRLVDWKLSV